MLPTISSTDPGWLPYTLEALKYAGAGIVTDVLSPPRLEHIRGAMYEAQAHTLEEVGKERLDRAGEAGIMRVMLGGDPVFLKLLELPEVLGILDSTVSNTAIMNLQNGLILAPYEGSDGNSANSLFHMDFPRYLDGYMASVNIMLAIDEFTAENGATRVVPGTHQHPGRPEEGYMQDTAVAVECPPGSMIAFDSTLWHAPGRNTTNRDRAAINHMFTRSFFKPQIDYVRALGDDFILEQPPRIQQLLGWYTRVVTSSDEYYRPREERLYRANQG